MRQSIKEHDRDVRFARKVKSLKADVSSVGPSSAIDEGLTLETSAFQLLLVANLHYQDS